jgi:copper(I)-binding protein
MIRPSLLVFALVSCLLAGWPGPELRAHQIHVGKILVIHPIARPNLPNRPMVVYMAIENDGDQPDRLLRASAPDFDAAEFHASAMQGATMTMQPVGAIDLPPHEIVRLAPGGFHIMLFDARTLYRADDTFPVILTFENAGEVRIDVLVEAAEGGAAGAGTDHSGHGGALAPQTGN